jgi:hypothetical protein
VDFVRAGIEAIQECVVVSNDLFEAEIGSVGRGVTVTGKDYVVTKADGAANGCVDAVLGHASADDKLPDADGHKFGVESGLEEGVAGAFADDPLTRSRCNFRTKLPARRVGFQPVTGTAIVLDVDGGHGDIACSLDESGNTSDRFVESLVDLLLAAKVGKGEDVALNVNDEESGLGHISG